MKARESQFANMAGIVVVADSFSIPVVRFMPAILSATCTAGQASSGTRAKEDGRILKVIHGK
jgi:hypothetical protein